MLIKPIIDRLSQLPEIRFGESLLTHTAGNENFTFVITKAKGAHLEAARMIARFDIYDCSISVSTWIGEVCSAIRESGHDTPSDLESNIEEAVGRYRDASFTSVDGKVRINVRYDYSIIVIDVIAESPQAERRSHPLPLTIIRPDR